MFTDDQTARDLELFAAQHEGPSLFDLINRAATQLGSRALHRRFSNPLSDPHQIRAVQASVRFLARSGMAMKIERRVVAHVERYLDARYDTSAATLRPIRWAESAWIAIRYRGVVRFANEGVSATLYVTRTLKPLISALVEGKPPPLLAALVDELAQRLSQLSAFEPRRDRGFWALLERDRWFRREAREAAQRMLELLGEIDALFAMAEAIRALDLALPEVIEAPAFELQAKAVRHPFLDAPIANPVDVVGGETLVFLTGPNMAGKTTYLKAVGIAMHLAHCGMGVPAVSMRFAPVDRLMTSLRPEDNLREGLSFFLAEVRRVREVAEWLAAGRRAFVIFDEIFRGTNVRDALEASKTVVLGFGRTQASGFIISSHLTELADDLSEEPSVRFAYFDGDIEDGVARYSFKIRDGVSRKRFGLQLLEQEQVPSLLAAIPLSGRPLHS